MPHEKPMKVSAISFRIAVDTKAALEKAAEEDGLARKKWRAMS
jgi:hypothetical protein